MDYARRLAIDAAKQKGFRLVLKAKKLEDTGMAELASNMCSWNLHCSKKSNQGQLAYWTNCKVLGESKLGKRSPPQRENFFTSAETMIIQLVTNDDTMMHM